MKPNKLIRLARLLVRWITSPLEILLVLESIDSRLAKVEEQSERFGRCINDRNHQRRMSVTTGHWNQ